MIRRATCLALLVPLGQVATAVEARPYLKAAEQSAAWLVSVARPSGSDGLSWPASDTRAESFTGLESGGAGIGLFFLRLHTATSNPKYLETAVRASNAIAAEYALGRLGGPDWLFGAAGGGSFFLELFRQTQDPRQLERSEAVARWLVQHATQASDGYYWRFEGSDKLFTGVAHGAAGVGDFLLGLYEVTHNPLYLQYAEGAYRWTARHTVTIEGDAMGWKRLSTDAAAYHQWCGGSVGMIFFLEHLHAVTGNATYKDALRRTADGLVKTGKEQAGGGRAWSYGTDGGSLPTVYCHGTSSLALALYHAWKVLGDSRYLEAARAGAQWVESVKLVAPEGRFRWEHILGTGRIETGYLWGTASVGRAFVAYREFDPQPSYIEHATGAGVELLAIADHPTPEQARWVTHTSTMDLSDLRREYQTGWFSGAAGIGLFLLSLDQALNEGVR